MSWLQQAKARKRVLELEEAELGGKKFLKVEEYVVAGKEGKTLVSEIGQDVNTLNSEIKREVGSWRLDYSEISTFKADVSGRVRGVCEMEDRRLFVYGSDPNGTYNIVQYSKKNRKMKLSDFIIHRGSMKKKLISCGSFIQNGKSGILGLGEKCLLDFDSEKMTTQVLPALTGFPAAGLNGLKTLKGSNSNFLGGVNDEGRLMVIEGDSRSLVSSIRLSSNCNCICFHPKLPWLIAGDDKGRISVWDFKTGKCLSRMTSTLIKISGVAVNSENQVAVGSPSGVVHIFEINIEGQFLSEEPRKEIRNLRFETNLLSFDPSGRYLAIGSNSTTNQVRILRLKDFSIAANFPLPGKMDQFNEIVHLTWGAPSSTGNPLLILCETNGRIKVFELNH